MKYIKGFDTIRAVAILIVIVGHWGLPFVPRPPFSDAIDSFIQFGRFGVTLFFVLSGFLITSILLNERKNHLRGTNLESVKKFFARRILRIFPIYYLFLAIILLSNNEFVRQHMWFYIFYSSNLLRGIDKFALPHFWTLAVEEQFYFIWPWLIFYVPERYTKYIFVSFIFIGLFSQYFSNNHFHLPYGFISADCFDSFGLGALYAYMRFEQKNCAQFEHGFKILLPVCIFFAWKTVSISGIPAFVIFARFVDNLIALALIIFAINNRNRWITRYLLENKLLNFIGKISYGIYVFHFTFNHLFYVVFENLSHRYRSAALVFNNEYLYYGLKFGMLIFLCWLSYRFIEQPILQLKRYFNYSKQLETTSDIQ